MPPHLDKVTQPERLRVLAARAEIAGNPSGLPSAYDMSSGSNTDRLAGVPLHPDLYMDTLTEHLGIDPKVARFTVALAFEQPHETIGSGAEPIPPGFDDPHKIAQLLMDGADPRKLDGI